jgi:hypothetical protein
MSSGAEVTTESWFEECVATLGEVHDENVYAAIERLVEAGCEVGFTVADLIRMLKTGMTVESLLDNRDQNGRRSSQYSFLGGRARRGGALAARFSVWTTPLLLSPTRHFDSTRSCVSCTCRAPGRRQRASPCGQPVLESVVIGFVLGACRTLGSFEKRTGPQRSGNPCSLPFVSG